MNLNKYNECFKDVLGVEDSQLNGELLFGKDNWNSLAHKELIATLEDTFDILFSTEDITHFGGYENGKKLLVNYGISL